MNKLNDLLERLEEYLQEIDKKNKILLYFSIAGLFGLIYYYLNFNYLYPKIEKQEKIIKKLRKKANIPIENYIIKLASLKKKYKHLVALKNKKFQDLEYVNERINRSFLKISEKDFYSLLEDILYKSYSLNLTPSFYIKESVNTFKKYIVNIDGEVDYCQEKNLFDLIKFLESRKYVVSIDKFSLDVNGSKFFIEYNIWGLK